MQRDKPKIQINILTRSEVDVPVSLDSVCIVAECCVAIVYNVKLTFTCLQMWNVYAVTSNLSL